MFIWSFNINRAPYGTLVKHKACLCAHGVMQEWWVDYWYTYFPVVNWMYVRSMLTLIILLELHTKSIFFLAYTQADVKTDIFMELPIGFGVEGSHPIEWVIILDNNLYMA